MKAAIIRNLRTILLAGLLAAAPFNLHAATEGEARVQSLRGADVQALDPDTAVFTLIMDREPVKRNFDKQPPLVPHPVEDYKITLTANKCLECHSWTDAEEDGPTKFSRTHFKDSSSTDDANLSKRRYFCVQCHVAQTDAKPLVENSYKPPKAKE